MARKSAVYGNESISSLKGADRVRKRPAVIFGSDGIEGCQHSVFEILSNSIDEAREGHGNKIIMTKYSDGAIEVEDFARGIPVDYNKNEDRYNWELLFCEMYAGGKYNNNSGDNYEFSLGLNGLGLCATQYASEYMTVDINRDGFAYHLDFEKGENVGGLHKTETGKRTTGSKIKWKPDNTVFSDINIPDIYFEEVLKRQAVVNPNVLFIFKNQKDKGFETKEYFYEKGIVDYVEEICDGENLTKIIDNSYETSGKDRDDMPEYKVKMNVAFAFSNKVQKIEYYHNSSFLEYGGSPEKAVKSAFVSQIDAFAKQKNLYKKNESKITFQDIEDCLVFVSSCFSTMTSYENQTKKAITNKFIAQAMTEFLKRTLEVYFIENPEEALKVVQQVIVNKQSREQAEKTRISLKKTISEKIDLANRVQKFVDCRSKDVSKREVYIVEGDSALGACKTSRDAEFQALMPVRGKILNCLKCDYDRIFKSDIITDLIKVLGCGVESPAKYQKAGIATFNIDNLRWNKVVICTDADVDGFQIRTLILTMLYRLCPQLIDDGYVYIAESPLYEINTKDKTYFAYTEEEKKNIISRIEKQKFTIQRSKGLGENEPEMMWITTMNPETRRLIKVCKEDVERTQEMFELLLGDNLAGRKQYIQDFGADYLDQLDLS
ncbi:MAG: DNA topoisomerase [Oscillospiraceae bacterium]|nr:DNA topoisomerase [Oscillospiraceae bacterium]MBQ5324984.1 DNA topoisomerase [Oscillospiraceae bacterium]